MTRTGRLPLGAGFALLLVAVGASGGVAFGVASRAPAEAGLRADLARSAAERDRLEAELRAARADAERAVLALDEARQGSPAGPPPAGAQPDPGERPGTAPPSLRRLQTAPRPGRPPAPARP
ncbi:MAG TPA: hypothetical protein VHL98_00555 [Microvirga sp.]|jgi:hypothetical protein|nr:hypothetical protein [Microvirga sp.]